LNDPRIRSSAIIVAAGAAMLFAAALRAAETLIEADVPLFVSQDQRFYRLPGLSVTSRGTVWCREGLLLARYNLEWLLGRE
jgi:hypothetical protein